MNERKVPYIPSERYRFEVSQDTFSRERIGAISQTNLALKDRIPFYGGLIVFGSLSKGKQLDTSSARYTDIESIVYLDTDKILQTYRDEEQKEELLKSEIDRRVDFTIRQGQLSGISLTREDVLARDPGIIIASAIEYTEGVFDFDLMSRVSRLSVQPSEVTFDIKPISVNGPYSPEAYLRQFVQSLSQGVDIELTDFTNVAGIFGLDIDGSLHIYRKALLEQLNTYGPEQAEHLWQIVLASMIKFERMRDSVSDSLTKFYPQTYRQARIMHGLT